MHKRILAALLVLALLLAGCGTDSASAPTEAANTQTAAQTTVVTEAAKSTTEAESAPTEAESAPTEAERFTYEDENCSVSVAVVPGWAYAETKNGVLFYPEGQTGFISLCWYGPHGFAVCGTGLATEEWTVGGFTGEKGTFDGGAVWDYFALAEPYGGYVAETWEVTDWYAENEETVLQILSSAELRTTEEE